TLERVDRLDQPRQHDAAARLNVTARKAEVARDLPRVARIVRQLVGVHDLEVVELHEQDAEQHHQRDSEGADPPGHRLAARAASSASRCSRALLSWEIRSSRASRM